jgi:CHAD domain-containing protein
VLGRIAALRETQRAALLRGWSRVGDRYLPDALHALRRRIRRLRYAAELEDALRKEESRAPALWKRLQDAIGGIHDHHLLAAWCDGQARAAEARRREPLALAARREARFFRAEGRRLHRAFVAGHPGDLALRALEAMRHPSPRAARRRG